MAIVVTGTVDQPQHNINGGFSDTIQLFNGANGHYSWWSDGFSLEEVIPGWRLDYFFVNAFIRLFVTSLKMLACFKGPDHCPMMMEMEMPEQSSSGTAKVRQSPIRMSRGLLV
jgi:exonuclease III